MTRDNPVPRIWKRLQTAGVLPDLASVARRFPVPVGLAVYAWATTTWQLATTPVYSNSLFPFWRVLPAFLAAVAIVLAGEARGLAPLARHGAALAVALVIYCAGLWGWWLDPASYVLALGLMLAVPLAPYVGRPRDDASCWRFAHDVWLAVAIAIFAALLVGAGVSAVLGSISYLFAADLPSSLFGHVGNVAVSLVGPLAWLAGLPERFDRPIEQGAQTETTSRGVAAMVKFLLAPLLLVYTAILYVYALKIGFEAALPKSRLGYMVLGYGTASALTALMAWPTRATAGPIVALFWRSWHWLVLPPVALLFMAVIVRVRDYGLTEQRYMLLLVGVWLVVTAAWLTWRPGRDLRVAPGVLAALVLAASVGPWGALGASVASQKGRLQAALTEAGVFRDGRIVALPAGGKVIEPAAFDRIRDGFRYLATHGRLGEIADWRGGLAAELFRDPVLRSTYFDANPIMKAAGLVRGEAGRDADLVANFARSPQSNPVVVRTGTIRVIGPYNCAVAGRIKCDLEIKDAGRAPIGVEFADGVLNLGDETGRRVSFDLQPIAAALLARRTAVPGTNDIPPELELVAAREASDAEARFLVSALTLRSPGGKPQVTYFRGWMVLPDRR